MTELKEVNFITDNSILERRIDLEIKQQDMEMEYNWRSCLCNKKTDSRLLKYGTTMFILFVIICFCMFKLEQAETCDETTTYIALLTLILGLIFPSPTFKKN